MDTSIEVPMIEETSSEQELANVWARLAAYMIDVVLIYAVNGIIFSPVKFMSIPLEWGYWTTIGTLSVIVYYLYFFFATKLFAKTLGKYILSIKVVSINKENPSWGDIFFREIIGRIIHNVFLILKFLYIYILVSDKKQGFHDVLGQTQVVKDTK